MRHHLRAWSFLLVLAVVAMAGGPEVLGSELPWTAYTKGMEQGKKLNKDIYINFYAEWCGYCHQMDAVTYQDRAVADYLTANFVLIKVDADRAKDLAEAYSVRGLPMGWFVTAEGERIGPMNGYVDPDTFLTILKFVSTKSYNKMTYQEFVDKQEAGN